MPNDNLDPTRSDAVDGLFGDARGRLLLELCGQPQTAAELARRVKTSSNAVRVHLDGLRRAGLVDYVVEKRGVGKPRHVYAITATAENLLSSAYTQTLAALLALLRQRMNSGFLPLLRDAGSLIAKTQRRGKTGVTAAVAALKSLGASVTIERTTGAATLSARCCPLAAVTRDTREVCDLVESLLTSASGLTVTQHCARGAHPRCHFLVDR